MMSFTDLGIFRNVVAGAGSIAAMSTAMLLGFKERARWEPSDEDLDKGAQKVGSLVAGVSITFIFLEYSRPEDVPTLIHIALLCSIIAVVCLLLYGSLITMFVHTQWKGTKDERNIIGGMVLRAGARQALRRERELAREKGEVEPTVQELFMGAIYDMDKLWSGSARALAKSLFILGYLGLTVAGTVALASASIAISHKTFR